MLHRRQQAGATLIELLFAIGIMGVVSTAIYQLLIAHHANYRFQQSRVDSQQKGRIGLSTLARELRWSGHSLLLADPVSLSGEPSCHLWDSPQFYELVDEHSLRFLSNLHGIQTFLSKQALPGDTGLLIPDDGDIQENGLAVSSGQDFEKNDTIYIYHLDPSGTVKVLNMECHKLTSGGTSGRIPLAPGDSIRASFPPNSPIYVVNELHYFLDPSEKRLMRQLDGGTEVLVDGVENVIFRAEGDWILIDLNLIEEGTRLQVFETSVVLRNQ